MTPTETAVLPSGEQFTLAYDDQRAVVVEIGGGLRCYASGGRDLLDGYRSDEQCASGRGQVLAPWPNRLQDGRYDFDGRSHQLPLTEPEHGNAIHGLVRWVVWTAAERDPHRVLMRHVIHPQPGYPFTLALSVEYVLSERGLSVRTTATNIGAGPCPYGAGAHPYLTLGAAVDSLVLHAPGRRVVLVDDRDLPVDSAGVEGTEYDFRSGRQIGTTVLDNAFTDLERDGDGLARVRLDDGSGGGVTLWVDEGYPYLMLFTGDPLPDVDRRALAVEPMTCPPNAFRSGESLIRLEPGSSTTSRWGITP
jgi:aldose 1-epimerase